MSDNATHEAPPADEIVVVEAEEPAPAEPQQQDEPDTEDDSGNGEAAKYRRQLRETEAERNQLREQVTVLQRQYVESEAAKAHVKPAAVWAVTELPDLLDETGAVSDERIAAAIQAARDTLGVPVLGKGNIVPGVGNMPSGLPKTDGWADAFNPRTR